MDEYLSKDAVANFAKKPPLNNAIATKIIEELRKRFDLKMDKE